MRTSKNNAALLHLLFLLLVVVALAMAGGLAWLHDLWISAPKIDKSLLAFQYQNQIRPEPRERFVFLTMALVMPVITMAGVMVLNRRAGDQLFTTGWKTSLLICCNGFLIYFPFTTFDFKWDFTDLFVHDFSVGSPYTISTAYAALAASACWCWYASAKSTNLNARRWQPCFNTTAWTIFGFMTLLQLMSWRLLTGLSIARTGAWAVSADAVFYSVSQVVAGKTLLIDLPSQYGFFPEMLAPIFKMMGLSVKTFLWVCGAMQIAVLMLLHWTAQRVMRDPAIKMAFAVCLVTTTFGTLTRLAGMDELNLQYWPIRFFWPALSVWAFYRYAARPSPRKALQVSLIGALGMLWNLETGLVVVISFAGTLTAKWLLLRTNHAASSQQDRACVLRCLAQHVATIILVLIAAFLYLRGKSPDTIHWQWLIGYQRLFYELGFGMLPMPLYPQPWMSVLGIYVMAWIVAVQKLCNNKNSTLALLFIFVGLLGLGLFIYYQGRSHPLNLISVCWPAIFLSALMADRVLRKVRAQILPKAYLVMPAIALSVMVFMSVPLIAGAGRLASDGLKLFENRGQPADPVVSDELNFLRQHAQPGAQCLILSLRQGLYYTETAMKSPLSGPGYVEMILQTDVDDFFAQLHHTPPRCLFLGVGPSSALGLGLNKDPAVLFPDHQVMATSLLRSMLYLEPR